MVMDHSVDLYDESIDFYIVIGVEARRTAKYR